MSELILDPSSVDFANLDKAFTPSVVSFKQPNEAPVFSNLRPGQVHSIALPKYRDKRVSDVARHVFETYADDFYIPGFAFLDWLVKHYDSAPPEVQAALAPLINTRWYHLFGSAIRHSGGPWSVPCVGRVGSGWRRGASWFGSGWMSGDRVVLLDPAPRRVRGRDLILITD